VIVKKAEICYRTQKRRWKGKTIGIKEEKKHESDENKCK
jgi:hypothetical protein